MIFKWLCILLGISTFLDAYVKKKAVHKTTTTDDKRLQSTLKRIGVNSIPSIEEVNIFKDETVIQFLNPKVQASIGANTWVVSGTPQTKSKLPFILLKLLSNVHVTEWAVI
ncbi:putative nascent polypeptide-associated complex NAC domain, NAC A/B domain superfamily [Helianthus debilis subsp. tardiflorus]